jgi:signal transduction histidine kinase
MKTPIPFLKQYEAWATDLTDRYTFNPFFQATVHIIAIQLLLAILLIGVTGWAITVVRAHTFAYVFCGLIVLIALFGYLLIRFALAPAKNSVQFQKRFIGNVAHEIRTPLAIIKTSTEVALMDPSITKDFRETLQDTITELDRISETINNLLSFDNLIRPERMKTQPLDMSAIAELVVERHQSLANSRGVDLVLFTGRMQARKRLLKGNPVAIEEVLTNLVKNAINYTPANAGGQVTVRVEPEFVDKIAVTVTDTGIGIAQKDLMHIFEPFYRGDTSRARNIGTGASGLGLAIVNEIARMHHGTTTVRSVLGKGTSIKIAFPVASAEELAEFSTPVDADGIREVAMDFS